jgi:hypothetical protein
VAIKTKAKYKVGDILYLGKAWGTKKGTKVRVVNLTYESEWFHDGKKIKGKWKYKTHFVDKKGWRSRWYTISEKDLRRTKP